MINPRFAWMGGTMDEYVLVRASDVREMMDYYQRDVSPHLKSKRANQCYERLWDTLKELDK